MELNNLKQEYAKLTSEPADPADDIDAILNPKPKLEKKNNVLDTVDQLTDLIEEEEGEEKEEVGELKPLSYVKKKYQASLLFSSSPSSSISLDSSSSLSSLIWFNYS